MQPKNKSVQGVTAVPCKLRLWDPFTDWNSSQNPYPGFEFTKYANRKNRPHGTIFFL